MTEFNDRLEKFLNLTNLKIDKTYCNDDTLFTIKCRVPKTNSNNLLSLLRAEVGIHRKSYPNQLIVHISSATITQRVYYRLIPDIQQALSLLRKHEPTFELDFLIKKYYGECFKDDCYDLRSQFFEETNEVPTSDNAELYLSESDEVVIGWSTTEDFVDFKIYRSELANNDLLDKLMELIQC